MTNAQASVRRGIAFFSCVLFCIAVMALGGWVAGGKHVTARRREIADVML
jgi:hypothetical protein